MLLDVVSGVPTWASEHWLALLALFGIRCDGATLYHGTQIHASSRHSNTLIATPLKHTPRHASPHHSYTHLTTPRNAT
ncbi:hypothetical protein Pmani_019611 [Petrolisthes manimaculis]|uniref:Uncharacterized protein n=1 Tax=Petrolisthes manimaculis TaxID=1843537 RepID=A0AAE1PKC4_9EUCA|nr:hypothetical protein Pmani_019611 [Petrolisthes manimaculis]